MTIQPYPFSGAPNGIQGGVLMPPGYQQNTPNIANYQPGQYSQMAYQMAGSPHMGPYPTMDAPPLVPYDTGGMTGSSGSGASSVIGALNDINKAKNLYNNISGVLNPGVSPSQLSSLYASQGAPATVDPLITTPAQAGITPVQGPLYSGASGANADLAAQEADQYTANGGILGGGGGAAAALPAGVAPAVTAADAAAAATTSISPEVAASINDAAAAEGGADAAAGSGSAAGMGVGGTLLTAGLLYNLEQGLTSPGFSPTTGYAINQDLGNFNATVGPWLNSSGPGLAYMTGDGSSAYPLGAVLKNGTQLNQDQLNQLQALYKQGYLQANPNTYSTHAGSANMTLPPDIQAQMNQILSQAAPAPAHQNLDPSQLDALNQAMQIAQQYAQQSRSGLPYGVLGG